MAHPSTIDNPPISHCHPRIGFYLVSIIPLNSGNGLCIIPFIPLPFCPCHPILSHMHVSMQSDDRYVNDVGFDSLKSNIPDHASLDGYVIHDARREASKHDEASCRIQLDD